MENERGVGVAYMFDRESGRPDFDAGYLAASR